MMSENMEIRYCKKCGCELMSSNTKKLCESCRRNRNNNIKKGLIGFGGTLSAIALAVFTGKKSGDIKKE